MPAPLPAPARAPEADAGPESAPGPALRGEAAEAVRAVVRSTFGFDALRPLQAESIAATLAGRDALTVLPTGGGKSLCYQVPPLVTGRLTLVVSPLIALMQDQVAALRMAGVPAAAVHGNAPAEERRLAREAAARGDLRLLFAAPERLLLPDFLAWAGRLGVGAVAIDEAHCISQWGHDFRPEYRRLAELRDAMPAVAIGAFTATATPRVRRDIVEQLRLRDPAVLVGSFDRPNLTYRILPRVNLVGQVVEALRRHDRRAAIVYCISRRDTEGLAAALAAQGINAAAYHAGMEAGERTRVSEAFRAERLDVVVATVAFGMGIDRGDVRCVVHAAMPKSIEHYQQETGRAGRDGLPAECLLLYSAADVVRWRQLAERSALEGERDPAVVQAQHALLEQMHRLAGSARCRHAAISEYFGQAYPRPNCGACDVCLRELRPADDAHETARKIISGVARCRQSFGAAHVADVLVGKATARVRERGHDQLSTFGLLRHLRREQVINYINQLVDSGDLARSEGEYPIIGLTAASAAVLRNERTATLVEPKAIAGRTRRERLATGETRPLSERERALFEALRKVRRELAEARHVPPFVIFGDATLEEICRVRPGSRESLSTVKGIGTAKVQEFGEEIIEAVRVQCLLHGLELDAEPGSRATPRERTGLRQRQAPPAEGGSTHDDDDASALSTGAAMAAPFFRRGEPLEQVAAAMGRTPGTVEKYLAEFVRIERPASIRPWVDEATERRILAAAAASEDGRLKPIFDRLGGEVPYCQIRLALAHRAHSGPPRGETGRAGDR